MAGKVTPEESELFRQRAKEAGSIIALAPGDRLLRLWCGHGTKFDVMFVLVKSPKGELHFMGRLRQHVDDKTFHSEDTKHPVHLVVSAQRGGPRAEEACNAFRAVIRGAAGGFGFAVEDLEEFNGHPGREALDEVMRLLRGEVPKRIPGWHTGVQFVEAPGEEN